MSLNIKTYNKFNIILKECILVEYLIKSFMLIGN